MSSDKHPLAGRAVSLNDRAGDPVQKMVLPGAVYEIEDWWINLAGKSWQDCDGNIAAMHYALRSSLTGLPLDDDVVYGHIDSLGHLVHVSELGGEVQ